MSIEDNWTDEIMRDLVCLARSLRQNEAEITRQYANLAKEHAEFGSFEGLQTADVVAVGIIGENSRVNGVFITERMGLTKSGVSKILARLRAKELIASRKLKSDYKSIYYSLTPKGRKVLQLHNRLYSVAREELRDIFDAYSAKERKTIEGFVRNTAEALDRITRTLSVKQSPCPVPCPSHRRKP